jgi:glycosyltransferase involved in cell wall biosynthesis
MIRILSPQLGISPHSNLGGTVADREMLKALAGLGARIDMPLPLDEPFEQVPGWHVVQAGRHRFYTYEYNLHFLPVVERLWRTHPFDLFRVHSPSLAPLGLWMKWRTTCPLVAHYHHIEADKQVQNRLTQVALHSYDLVTLASRFVLGQLVDQFGFDATKGVVTYPGVAPHYQPGPPHTALRAELGGEGRLLVLSLGVLVARKNLHLLLDAFAAARAQRPELLLVVAGDGPQRADLERAARVLGIENAVRFVGYVDEQRKLALLQTANLFVFPSLLEGFGMVVAEAMACGLPVISSNAASLPEVTGDAALTANPHDRNAFTAALVQMTDNPDLRLRLAAEGQARVRTLFSWQRSARIALDAYRTLLPNGRKGAN